MEYRVIWEIDIEAESPKAAAEEALNIQQDKGSEARVFKVTNPITNKEYLIDLLED